MLLLMLMTDELVVMTDELLVVVMTDELLVSVNFNVIVYGKYVNLNYIK